MISVKSCEKDTSALVHWFLSRKTHCGNLFSEFSNKDTSKCLYFLDDHSFTIVVYISLHTSTQALSTFWTSILSTVIRDWLHLAQWSFSILFPDSSITYSAIYFSWKSIDYPFLYLLASCTWSWQTQSWGETPNIYGVLIFSLNDALPLPSTVLFDTAPDIDPSKERIDWIIGHGRPSREERPQTFTEC